MSRCHAAQRRTPPSSYPRPTCSKRPRCWPQRGSGPSCLLRAVLAMWLKLLPSSCCATWGSTAGWQGPKNAIYRRSVQLAGALHKVHIFSRQKGLASTSATTARIEQHPPNLPCPGGLQVKRHAIMASSLLADAHAVCNRAVEVLLLGSQDEEPLSLLSNMTDSQACSLSQR